MNALKLSFSHRCKLAALLFLMPVGMAAQAPGWVRHYSGVYGCCRPIEVTLTRDDDKIWGRIALRPHGERYLMECTPESESHWVFNVVEEDGSMIHKFNLTLSAEGRLDGQDELNSDYSIFLEPDCRLGSVQLEKLTVSEKQFLVKPKTGADTNEVPFGIYAFRYYNPVEARNPDELAWVKETMEHSFFSNHLVPGDPIASMSQLKDTFMEEYLSQRADYDTTGESFFYTWEIDCNVRVIMNETGFLCLESGTYSYLGGAHGGYSGSYLILDVNEQKEIGYQDIFTEDEKTKAGLSKLLKQQLFADMEMMGSPIEYLTEILFEDKLEPNQNVYLTHDGIGFLYNEYEIAPYSAGTIDIHLTWDQVEKYLRKDAPVHRLIVKAK